MTDPMHIHEPTGPLTVAYTDHGILLSWQPDPDDPSLCRGLPLGIDVVASAVDALAGCAADGEDRDCFSYALSTSADGTKVALLWAQDDGVHAVAIPRDAVPALTAAMQQAMDDRDDLLRHDWEIGEADPDDFR